jgi:CHASE3 domain sensor protein
MNQNDKTVPNKTIAILIIVALLVTIISTWVILGAIKTSSEKQIARTQTVTNSDGDVTLQVLAPTASPNKISTGQVKLKINSNT